MGLSGSAAAAAHPILAHNCAAWTTILTQGVYEVDKLTMCAKNVAT
jgi:hypothetical protein